MEEGDDGAEQDLLKSMLGRRDMSLDEDQAKVMKSILDSDKPLMHVSALAGTGKSVVLGLLMDMMMISDRHVIVLVPSRVLRDQTVITHGKQAGLAEDVVDERVLWLGRPPSKSGDLKSIGMFADQLEERVTEKLQAFLPKLREIEKELMACRMQIVNDRNLDKELQKILPFSESWWTSWFQHNGVSVTAFWLVRSQAYLPFLKKCPQIQEALAESHEALDLRGGEQSPAPLLGGAVQSQVHRGHHRCLLEVEGRPDQGHDRTDGRKSSCPFRRSSAGRG